MSAKIPSEWMIREDIIWQLTRDNPALAVFASKMTFDQLKSTLDKTFEGGYARFFEIHYVPVPVPDSELDPQIALARKLKQALGRDYVVAACHEILRVDVDSERVTLVVRVITEVERGTEFLRKIEERKAVVRVISFNRVTSAIMPHECIEFADKAFEGVAHVNSHLKSTINMQQPSRLDLWELEHQS